jgi:hypothetical protein
MSIILFLLLIRFVDYNGKRFGLKLQGASFSSLQKEREKAEKALRLSCC